MNADTVRELLSNATPGPWALWDSCSWRRFRNTDHQIVAEPYVAHDGHPDLQVTPGTAALIAATPTVAQWGLERDAEVARLREALRSVLDEAWDGQTVYAVDAGTLAKAVEVLWASEAKR